MYDKPVMTCFKYQVYTCTVYKPSHILISIGHHYFKKQREDLHGWGTIPHKSTFTKARV